MGGQDFLDLKADIEAHGQREPVWTYHGAIIDGRNRYRACTELGIEPELREWDGQGSLVAFVVSLNLHRRHLSSSQRATVAAEMLPMLEKEAKERQRRHGGTAPGRKATPGQKVDGVNGQGRAADGAAKIAGTNRQYVTVAKRLMEERPDLFEQVKQGKLKITQAKERMRYQHFASPRVFPDPDPDAAAKQQERARHQEIKAEVLARPEFKKRQRELERQYQELEEKERQFQADADAYYSAYGHFSQAVEMAVRSQLAQPTPCPP
jgi:hypothetical protein